MPIRKVENQSSGKTTSVPQTWQATESMDPSQPLDSSWSSNFEKAKKVVIDGLQSLPSASKTKPHMSTPCMPIGPIPYKSQRFKLLKWSSAEPRKTADPDQRFKLLKSSSAEPRKTADPDMDPSQPQDSAWTRNKSTMKYFYRRKFFDKRMSISKINRNNIEDFQTEVAKSSDNNDGFEKSSDNNDGLQSLPSTSTPTSWPSKTRPHDGFEKSSDNNDGLQSLPTPIPDEFMHKSTRGAWRYGRFSQVFGIQYFGKKIFLDGLQSLPSASSTRYCSLKITSDDIEDFLMEVTKSSDNNDGLEKSSNNNDGLQSLPSASTLTICPSKIKRHMSTPCTPIPDEFKWIRDTSTPEQRAKLRNWLRAEVQKTADPDERMRLLDWAGFVVRVYVATDPPPHADNLYLTEWAHPTSNNTAPNQHKRLRAHSTARIPAPGEPKRWSLQEEVTKPFRNAILRWQREIAIKCLEREIEPKVMTISDQEIATVSLQREIEQKVFKISYHESSKYPDLTQEHRIYTYKGEPGLYECQNALWIWAELIGFIKSSLLLDKGPKYVGEQFEEKIWKEAYDMIEERPSINELGFVTIKLSGKWIAKSIHNMLKDGLDTWAPELPVERVIVAHPSLDEGMAMDLIRMLPIRYTLMSILEYSKVDATIGYPMDGFKLPGDWASKPLNKWFHLFKQSYGEVLAKGRYGEVPFILPERDFENAYKDIFALWHGLHKHKADWIVYLTPVRNQAYIEMCLAAAKLEGWIPSDRHKPPRARYAGYQSSRINRRCFLFTERCLAVSEGEAAKLLGYSVSAVSDCVLRYTSLMNHRLAADCQFGTWMFNEKQNTFVYLLNTRAQIHRITNDYRKDIDEYLCLEHAILEKDEGWERETGEERVLGCHLLEFTEALEESCLSVMPHILCGYLYNLCKKFNSYHSSVSKDGFVGETSTLLLYEATAVVIEKCFHLLGILPKSSLFGFSMTQLLSRLPCPTLGLPSPTDVERPIGVNASDPTRNFRFEMVSFRTVPQTPLWLAQEGELFGLISVSDKIALSRSHFFETDVTHVPLFNLDWCNRIKHVDRGLVFLGNPGSGCSVSFSYFIEIYAELYVTNENECYQLCNQKKEIDLSSLWDTNSDAVIGELPIYAKHGLTRMHYFLLKDAIDTELKVKFEKKPDTPARLVRGYLQAYYGDEFLYKCQSAPIPKRCYMALLFKAAPCYELTAGYIKLIKSFLAVPTKGSLIIKAYLQDVNSNKVIINGTCNFKPLLGGYSSDTITGSEGCSLNVEVSWNYTGRYL